jgi:hypothetical protein
MATPSLSYQNKFATTLSSGVTATDTTIPLTNLPTPSEGYLILEPDSSTAWEEIYYTSKTGSAVVVPSVAAGRGVGGSTAASHSSGATVRMDSSAEMFTSLQDTTALTGLHTQNTERGFDHVASGCVWSGDAYASTRAASMTSGVVYINGRRHTVVAVTARTFTASKDTYVDLLYSLVDNIATPVYTEVTNNAASPALAANSIRIGIIVTGATTIAAVGSINQGEFGKVLPIASSQQYEVTDSLGNLICPRDANRKVLGYRQITSNASSSGTSNTAITGLSVPFIPPANRKYKATLYTSNLVAGSNNQPNISVWSGTVGSGTQLNNANGLATASAGVGLEAKGFGTGAGSLVTINGGVQQPSSGTATAGATSTAPAFLLVELE